MSALREKNEALLKMEEEDTREDRLLSTLSELGGGARQDDALIQQGNMLILPEGMSHEAAIEFLKQHNELQNEVTEFSHHFRFRPYDGAAAMQRALKNLFGTAGLPITTWSFFGPDHPKLIQIPVGVSERLQVPWGTIKFPLLEAYMEVGAYRHRELGMLFNLTVTAPRKYDAAIAGLFKAIEHELDTGSIYRGKAFDGQEQPDFIDLAVVEPERIIYSSEVEAQLKANVWSLIEYTQLQRDMKVPLKRAVLLEGPYGSGKTLAAFLTATIAVDNGWTFIYCRPGRDDLKDVMATARLYQPSIVFYEDVDTIAASGDADPLSELLDLFDGIKAKGTEIMVILTTNHREQIHKAMARPGRLDSIITIGAQDMGAVKRMIEVIVPGELLDREMDYEAIGQDMQGFMPAFVKEAIDRAMRYAIVRSDGKPEVLTTGDFQHAARGLRPQLELQASLGEGEKTPTLDTAIRTAFRESLNGAVMMDEDGTPVNPNTGGEKMLVTTNGDS